MRIAISINQDKTKIGTIKEYEPIDSKGEVAHFLAEIETIKQDLLEIWRGMEDEDSNLC